MEHTELEYLTSITPESIKAGARAELEAAGLDIQMREGSYTDLLLSEAAYQIFRAFAVFPSLLSAAIPGEKSGPYLDEFASLYGLKRTPGAKAAVWLTFTGKNGAVIPEGTQVLSGSDLRFSTTQSGTIADGKVVVPAQAEELGDQYNLGPDTITRMVVTIPGVDRVTNDQAVGGADLESDDSLYQRLHVLVSEPVASGNINHYKAWARSVPGVGHAAVLPLWAGNGTVKVLVASPDKQPVDGSIVEAARVKIQAERPIGANVTVGSVSALAINVAATVTLTAGTDEQTVQSGLETALLEAFSALEVGSAPMIRRSQVLVHLLSQPGVVDFSVLTINGGQDNIQLTSEQVPTLGTVTITKGVG